MTKFIGPQMRKQLAKHAAPPEVAALPFEITDEIARGTVDDDDATARLASWVAEGLKKFLHPDDTDNWSLFAEIAEMAMTLMLTQHHATGKALTTTQNKED